MAVVGRQVKYVAFASHETLTASAMAMPTSANSRAVFEVDSAVPCCSAIASEACIQVPVSRTVPPSASQNCEISSRSVGVVGSVQSASSTPELLPHVRMSS